MAICSNCNKTVPEGANYCSNCNTPMSQQTVDENPKVFCANCGLKVGDNTQFCPECGAPVRSPNQIQKKSFLSCKALLLKLLDKLKIRGRRWPVGVALLLVVVTLVTGLWLPGFFNGARNAGNMNGANYVFTGNSDAFSINPLPGVWISAAENALDQNREFVVSEAPEDQFINVSSTMNEKGVLVTNLYELDAGLGDDQQFPGVFSMEFDMATLQIPQELYEYARVYRISDSGEMTELAVTVDGSRLICHSEKNCLIAVGIALKWVGGILVAATVPAAVARTSIEHGDKWDKLDGKKLVYKYVCDGKYRVAWAVEDNSEIARKQESLDSLRQEIEQSMKNETETVDGMAVPSYGHDYNHQMAVRLANQAEYIRQAKELKQLIADVETGQTPQLKQAIDALTTAHNYLAYTRSFMSRSNVTDVLLIRDWPAGDTALGYSVNGYMHSPYILVNMSVMPNDGTAASADVKDDLLLTITHELFHVFQTNYTTIDWDSNIPFWEATAVVLEEEAYKDYTTNGSITTTQILTDSDTFELLSTPIDKVPASGESGDYQDFGYTLSRFVKYVLSNVQNSIKLENLLVAYKQTGSFSGALKTATGIDDRTLGGYYRDFCNQNIELFLNRHKAAMAGNGTKSALLPEIALSASALKQLVSVADVPLSAYFRQFNVDVDSVGGSYGLLLVPDDYIYQKQYYFPINPTAGVQTTPKGLYFPVTSEASSYLFEIHSYAVSDGISGQYMAYLLAPPENPTVSISSDSNGASAQSESGDGSSAEQAKKMVIKLPQPSTVASDGYIDGYEINITSSDDKVTTKYIPYADRETPLSLPLGDLTNGGEDVTFTVTAREYIVKGEEKFFGPSSQNGASGLTEEELDEQLIDAQAGTGEITVSMLWSTADDLDLHVITPSGAEIYFSNKTADGGTLDVDRQASSSNIVASPIENIYFDSPQAGTYKVFIVNYSDRTEGGDSNYMVRITVGGSSETFKGTIGGTGSTVDIKQITYGASSGN